MASYDNEKTQHQSDVYEAPPRENISVGQYLATRLPTLKPPLQKAPNPIRLLRMLNTQQWLFFLVGFFGWTWVRETLLDLE